MNQGPFVRSEMTECLNACWKKKISLRCGTARIAGRQADGRTDGWRNGGTDGCHLEPFWIFFDAVAEGGADGGGKVI